MSKQQTDASQKRKRVGWLNVDSEDIRWWPSHVQTIFAQVGWAMGEKRLRPETLRSVPRKFGSILPDHKVAVTHVSGKAINRRKGYYQIDVKGPRFAGRWRLASGQLEKLARVSAEVLKPDFTPRDIAFHRVLDTLIAILLFGMVGLGLSLPHPPYGAAGVLTLGGLCLLWWVFRSGRENGRGS